MGTAAEEEEEGVKHYSDLKSPHAEHRTPTISFKDMCHEFGVHRSTLITLLGRPDAPKPRVKASRDTYYDPKTVREWWACIAAEKQGMKS